MRNINVFAKKMARNGLKIANSLGCAFRFESDFTSKEKKMKLTEMSPLQRQFFLWGNDFDFLVLTQAKTLFPELNGISE